MSRQTIISEEGKIIEDKIPEVEHKYCRRCGRKLSNPISKHRGYGPTCWKKIGGNNARKRKEDTNRDR